jgi:hypothetical protein
LLHHCAGQIAGFHKAGAPKEFVETNFRFRHSSFRQVET